MFKYLGKRGVLHLVECGLTDLAACLPQKFFEYLLSILNAPLQPLLDLTKNLLTEPVNMSLFFSMWTIIIYIISLFYGLFMLFAGFNFLIAGYDASKRENAKMWFRNVILMIIFVQGSFYIYQLFVEIGARLTAGVVSIIDPTFFLLTADSIASFGLQFVLLIPYLLILVLTIIMLGLRYLLVSVGVVLFPIGIFFYFIPPLRAYGKMILNILFITIFIVFFDAIILFGASQLVTIPIYASFKVIVAIVAFFTVNILMVLLLLFAIIKAAFSFLNSDFGRNIVSAAKYLI